MSANTRFGGMGGYPLRPVGAEAPPPLERPISATSVVELAPEPSPDREIRIGTDGTITAQGPVEEHFSGALSYGARLGALVGELLGFDRLTAIDMQFKNKRWAMLVSHSGEVVAKSIANQDDLKRFKARFGL
ncbi:MAG: hypothetical protein KA712_03995 [Myxococcales bacterium]|nr:hypothetical protein [Myxococcales bacterium]